jgi:hypothetical protein
MAPAVLPILVIAAAVYALVFRRSAGLLAAHDAFALRMFTDFYLTLPGLVAALMGYTLLVRRSFWKDPALFLVITVFSFFFFYKIRIHPERAPFCSRRTVHPPPRQWAARARNPHPACRGISGTPRSALRPRESSDPESRRVRRHHPSARTARPRTRR